MSGKLIINVKQIKQNIKDIKHQTQGALFCAVVKANCYGLGIKLCKYIEEDIDYWAVCNLTEAKQLSSISRKRILVLSPIDKYDYKRILLLPSNIEYTVDSIQVLDYLINHNIKCNIHIAVNTGMNRYGTDYKPFIKMVDKLKAQNIVTLVGIYSHFYKNTKETMNQQYLKFLPFVNMAKQYKGDIICHISNSHGVSYPLDMVRVGIGLYNLQANKSIKLISYVKNIRTIHKGDIVSYEAKFIANKPTKVAVIPLGYADGIMRKLGGGYVFINNNKCKIIGNICMDCFMVDVTNCKNIKVGDKVLILGKLHKGCINICQVAQKCGTINYELLCRLGNRIKRVYKK